MKKILKKTSFRLKRSGMEKSQAIKGDLFTRGECFRKLRSRLHFVTLEMTGSNFANAILNQAV